MGVDHDARNTCLVLGLGFSSKAKKPTSTAAPSTNFEPFLTLSLSSESYHKTHEEPPNSAAVTAAGDLYRQGSSPSAVSSFSSGRIKRERDFSSEEVEVEKNSCRVSDEDEDAVNARKKLRLTKEQSSLLEESFKQRSTLNPSQKQALASQLNLKSRQVEVWFQNRRARTKLKQTEVDCEFLKRSCETLTNENRRLQKELQELKALKLAAAQPFYMPSASTLTMCPSCERIVGSGNENSKNLLSQRFLRRSNILVLIESRHQSLLGGGLDTVDYWVTSNSIQSDNSYLVIATRYGFGSTITCGEG